MSSKASCGLLLLIGYIWAISFMPDIRRLFGYHGAEHKTINAYEAGAPLTPEHVARFSLEHPRCGTAFLLTVVIISILVYTLLPPLSLPVRLLSRVLLLPLIAGIAYEFIRFTARHQGNPLIRLLTRPNLAMQRLTTREPGAANAGGRHPGAGEGTGLRDEHRAGIGRRRSGGCGGGRRRRALPA
jgi:uncharacterized protein YqhQ